MWVVEINESIICIIKCVNSKHNEWMCKYYDDPNKAPKNIPRSFAKS